MLLRIAVLLMIVVSVPVVSADGAGSDLLEVIVVSAQKREQNELEVPITITAYGGGFLSEAGIEEFDELSAYVPGLVVQEQSVNNPGFVIRGITSDSGSAQIAPRVSIYQDGVDISRSRGSIVELHDLERVEVLKGPQATLFGSGAAIGAISLVSARPTERFEGEVGLAVGNHGELKTRGFLSGPMDDKLGVRLAWIYKQRDGFIRNLDGGPDLNGTETLALRAFLNYAPSDRLNLDLILNYQEDSPPGTSFKSGTIAPAGGTTDPNDAADLGPFGSQPNDFLGGRLGINREVWSATLEINYDIGDHWRLTSVTNVREFDSLEVFDADGTPAYWLEFTEDAEGEQFSQELRFNYQPDGPWSGFFGLSFFHEEGSQQVPFSTDEGVFAVCSGLVPGVPCVNADGSVNSIFPVAVVYNERFANFGETDTFSIYADGTYALTDRMNLTVGVRYIDDAKTSGFLATGNPSVLTGGPLLPFGDTGGARVDSPEFDFDDVTPRALLDYRLGDGTLVYASVARGRRANVVDVAGFGGAENPSPLVTVLPEETVLSYDLGVKGALGDGLVYSVGVFSQDYEDFQTSIIDPASGDTTPVNAGSASNLGFEGELSGRLGDRLSFFANLAYLDAEFDQTDSDGNPQLFAGNRFRLQPRWSASAGATYTGEPAAWGSWYATLLWNFRSDVFFEDANQPIAGLDIAERDLALYKLRVGLESADQRWVFSAYVDNLFDKDYIIDAGNTGGVFGTPTFIAGTPRFYGVDLTFRLHD